MKAKFILTGLLLAGCSLSILAQGYKDGIEYYKVGFLDDAQELLERNLNAAATDKSEAYYYLGEIALHKNDAAKAARFFEQGLQANASNPYNLVGQGELALKQGGNGKALFDQARKLSKKDPKLEMAIARAFYDVNPTTYAKDIDKCIKNARKWAPNDPDSYIFEADTYADKREWGTAAGNYELAFTNDPNNVEAYVKYANTYFNVNPEMAIQRLEELNATKPNSALVQRQLAEKYYSDNQGVKAAEKYGEYIKNPNHFAQDEVRYVQLLFFGQKYQQSYDLASSLVQKLPATDPKVFYMRRMQLYNLVQLERWQQAAEAGQAFFAMAVPTNASYEVRDYTDYGTALQRADRQAEAVAAFEKAYELNPKNLDLLRNLADTYAAANDFESSVKYYQRVVDSPDSKANDIYELGVAYYNLALTTDDATKKAAATENARRYITEVDQKVPDNVRIVNQLAKVEKLSEGGEATGKAAPVYRRLIALLNSKDNPSDYDSYYVAAYNYLANYEFAHGSKEQAKEYYRLWLDHDPGNDALRKYVDGLK